MNRLPFPILNLLGATAFLSPLIMAGRGTEEVGSPWLLALLAPLLLAMAIAEISRGTLDSKAIALMGLLAACAALLRLPISFAGANLIFFIPIVAGSVFGIRFGFLVGAFAMGVSALLTGGIGPWLPFQIWGLAWVGAGAALVARIFKRLGFRSGLFPLIVSGLVSAFFYGLAMNLYFWPIAFQGDSLLGWSPGMGLSNTLQRFSRFYLTTSLAWDSVGAIANITLLALLGSPVAQVLERYRQRMTFQTILPAPPPEEVQDSTSTRPPALSR